MNTTQLNYVNIGLMVVSCVVAFIIPFELFLFSYAVLGPLHYLTEISWLHKRQCFSPGKKDFIVLGIFALLITIPNIFPHFYTMWGPKDDEGRLIVTEAVGNFAIYTGQSVPAIIFTAFAGAALLILTKSTGKRIIGFLLIAFVGYLFRTEKIMFIVFSVFLPTLVHVFLFTGVFILLGALKSKSVSGVLSFGVFIACAGSLFLFFPNTITPPTPYAEKVYDASFLNYSKQVFDTFLHRPTDKNLIYQSSIGIMLARFIAFAYTYHYLNWFSKTSVIKWHQVPMKSLLVILIIWILSLVLYFTDYQTGLMALYFLSFLHVIFEFPLNFRSFGEVGTHFKLLLKPASK
ncbi:MAG: hypothetical protein K0Q79_1702 [Flavipsychrobacter sp.]|jgi:hypothetical protein|nr:hypothetical protein [Flavipsychrobacter sp.]